MEAVEEAIDRRLKEQPDFEPFFKEDRLEGFFVKNLENVQGDERDVIFFSVGYGYDQQGQMTMNFGPLNKPGGERRLNVAVTRAREKVVLITSIKASDIDPETKAVGVQTLRYYLDYAENGPETLESVKPKEGEFESALDEDVAAEIKKMGYEIVPQVGCSGYRIDIGVVDPVNPGCFPVRSRMRRRHIQIQQQRTRQRPTARASAKAVRLADSPYLVSSLGCKTRL